MNIGKNGETTTIERLIPNRIVAVPLRRLEDTNEKLIVLGPLHAAIDYS
ncbi:MAG TPA: hypothetical protein VKV95_20635 [Terriglobia bacterium]|nr:hypothetical protein [Terriglobia bacterium]